MTEWGERKLAEAKRDLRILGKYGSSQVYSRA